MMQLRFDNAFVRELPGDPESAPGVRQVHGALYSRVAPTPVRAPRLLAYSAEMAATLGLGEADIASPEFAQVFAGNALLPGMDPYAANYGGHQFGHWAGQLGDGRAQPERRGHLGRMGEQPRRPHRGRRDPGIQRPVDLAHARRGLRVAGQIAHEGIVEAQIHHRRRARQRSNSNGPPRSSARW